MFVSIVCDMGSDDSRTELYNLLPQYGFEKVQRGCFECSAVSETQLAKLKRDIDSLLGYPAVQTDCCPAVSSARSKDAYPNRKGKS